RGGAAPDLGAVVLAEPERAVGSGRNSDRPRIRRRDREFDEAAVVRIQPADLAGAVFAEPEIAVGAMDDDVGLAVRRRNPVQHDLDVGHYGVLGDAAGQRAEARRLRPIALYCVAGEPRRNPPTQLERPEARPPLRV